MSLPLCLKDGVMMWSSSGSLQPPHWQPRSAQIEMTSYVLLALLRRGNLVEGIELMKWLSEQRNHLGSYGTTQVMLHIYIQHFCWKHKMYILKGFSILMCKVIKCGFVLFL